MILLRLIVEPASLVCSLKAKLVISITYVARSPEQYLFIDFLIWNLKDVPTLIRIEVNFNVHRVFGKCINYSCRSERMLQKLYFRCVSDYRNIILKKHIHWQLAPFLCSFKMRNVRLWSSLKKNQWESPFLEMTFRSYTMRHIRVRHPS